MEVKSERAIANQNKTNNHYKRHFLSNILTAGAITKYEMLRYSMTYKQMTRNLHFDILLTMYHEELI